MLERNGLVVPVYLVNVLKMIRLNSIGAFASLEDSDLPPVYDAIDDTIRRIFSNNDQRSLALVDTTDFRTLRHTGIDFKLPFGHKILIRLICHKCREAQNTNA